jgi:hypothetical protein
MIVYHGSAVIVKTPKILQSVRMLDFGSGFYTTTNREQAVRWAQRVAARRNTAEQFITAYEFDLSEAEKELVILRFGEPDETWLNFVCANRSGRAPAGSHDMVFGPVADDTVYTVVQFYENGVYDKEEAIKRLKVEKLFDQVLFHTEKALRFCRFARYEAIGGASEWI